MPPACPIELHLFDFVDEFAESVKSGKIKDVEDVEASSGIVEFCEEFFNQFLAAVGVPVLGFGPTSKAKASAAAIKRRDDPAEVTVRSLLALFEKFCDLHSEVLGGDYGSAKITYEEFHADYMRKLLARAAEWAEGDYPQLAVRVKAAHEVYDEALEAKGW
jgi:hypothetical protein